MLLEGVFNFLNNSKETRKLIKMKSIYDRRSFLRDAAITLRATELGGFGLLNAQLIDKKEIAVVKAPVEATRQLGPVKQIEAGLLNVGYVEEGPLNGLPVMLLHGWPYDIYTYVDVIPLLAANG